MDVFERVTLQLIVSAGSRVDLAHTLSAFESDAQCHPTHWATTRFLRDPYSREDVLRYVRQPGDGDRSLLYVKRVQSPRYVASISLDGESVTSIFMTSDLRLGPDDAAKYCAFASFLAGSLDVEFGLVDLSFTDMKKTEKMNETGQEHVPTYRESGPSTIYARTFFGGILLEKLGGIDGLRGCGLSVVSFSNGVCSCDLTDAPWKQGAHTLKEHQLRILECLRFKRVFVTRSPGRV